MKPIIYPGNSGQPCVTGYSVGLSWGSALSKAQILFVEEALGGNAGGTFCTFGDVPEHLVNRVLETDLKGCRLDLVEAYHAMSPDELGRRVVTEWKLKPDLFDLALRGGECDQVVYRTSWDHFKAKLGFRVTPHQVAANSYQLVGGTCRVKVEVR